METEAENERIACEKLLEGLDVFYEFTQLEGQGDVGEILKEYIQDNLDSLDMIVMGSSHKGTLEKWVVGSTTDYCLSFLSIPVTVVKEEE
jgi:nucleotide-binding universal stress UspA family protein